MRSSHEKNPGSPASSCVGILLAAGFGSRFLANSPPDPLQAGKLLACLPDGQTVATAAATALCAATIRVVAVTRPDTEALHALLQKAGCEVLVTPAASAGMGASLAAAARHLIATSEVGHHAVLVALADMPWIRAQTYMDIMRAAQHHAIVVPAIEGRRGHPVALQRHLWPELAALDGDVGARALLQRHPVFQWETDDPGILRDVDVPQDLA